MARGSRPTHFIAVTAKVGKGRYEKGPYIGLWESDKGPLYRGSVSGKYLDELEDFIKDYGEDAISFAVFESKGGGKGRRRDEDDEDEDQPPRRRKSRRDEDEDKGRGRKSSRRKSREDDDEEDEEKGRGRGKGRGSKKSKDDWWDED